MTRHVHFVGSIGLDTSPEIFREVGKTVGALVKRCPDGEVGGRRNWNMWQYPLLRSNPALEVEPKGLIPVAGVCVLKTRRGVKTSDVHFGELGYAREARLSYADFLAAREKGELPKGVRFQVCLPTPVAVMAFIDPASRPIVEPAYEAAMCKEVARIAEAIPHKDLAIQWDVCMEMIMWDGRFPGLPAIPDMAKEFAGRFKRLSAAVPADVELGIHLCYGDLDAKHFVEPEDAGKAVSLANLIIESAGRTVNWIHLPVPIERSDDAYFAPLKDLKSGAKTELYIGLVHGKDGVEGTKKRIAAAKKFVKDFGIATECGIARVRTPEAIRDLLRVHAGAAEG